jgi:NAD(P)-dependent dehydrogenase (short-subunit alcohol dehydrogenase family)
VKLNDKVAIITGGGRGIGQGIAYRFATEGAKVVIADRDLASAEGTAGTIRAGGGQASAVETDVSKQSEVEALIQTTLERHARIDILINCAGIAGGNGPFLEMPLERWQKVIDVNLTAVFLCSQAAARAMVAHGIRGRIINIGSLDSFIAEKEAAAYVASKGGVLLLTKAMAVDLAQYGILVNCIAPGSIRVDRNSARFDSEPVRTALAKAIPLGHTGLPEDIAAAAVFLSSDDSTFITGASLMVDGGYTAYGRVD